MSTPDFTAATWRKSSHSSGNAECVEIARIPGIVGVRDSKQPTTGPVLAIRSDTWTTFANQLA